MGILLTELMRIKAEGDYAAIKLLIDQYAVHFDPALRDQVVARYQKLGLPTSIGPVSTRGCRRTRAETARWNQCNWATSHLNRATISGLRRNVRSLAPYRRGD